MKIVILGGRDEDVHSARRITWCSTTSMSALTNGWEYVALSKKLTDLSIEIVYVGGRTQE
jgi:uncharacterized lipoprotein NlpE involved in copper resistance